MVVHYLTTKVIIKQLKSFNETISHISQRLYRERRQKMYVEIKDDKLLSWCENPYLDYQYVDIDYETFNPEKYVVVDGILTDVSQTDEYKSRITLEENEKILMELRIQVEELDKKRIRAIAEPALKDAQSGQTWLEYYTEQIIAIRAQIAGL